MQIVEHDQNADCDISGRRVHCVSAVADERYPNQGPEDGEHRKNRNTRQPSKINHNSKFPAVL